MGLLRTLLFIALFYYGFKILSRLFAPLLLKYVTKKAEQRFGGSFKNPPNRQQQKTEGEITIDKVPENKSSNNSVGEYVDYEEID